jgi:hypothetical protein
MCGERVTAVGEFDICKLVGKGKKKRKPLLWVDNVWGKGNG